MKDREEFMSCLYFILFVNKNDVIELTKEFIRLRTERSNEKKSMLLTLDTDLFTFFFTKSNILCMENFSVQFLIKIDK